MQKSIALLTVVFVLFFFELFEGYAEVHRLGLIKQDPREISWISQSYVQPMAAAAEVYYDPAFLPPVGNQGSQGSCTAWAVGYYFKTYQEAREKQWDPANPSHQCSPAFMYNQINGGLDVGSYISDAFKLLEDFGCGTLADMPYDAGDYSSWPGEIAYENGIPFRTHHTYYIPTGSSNGINQIKSVLNNGELLVIGISVYPNFDNISQYNYTYCVNDVYGNIRGGHAVTIIGYDDTKVTNDGTGAFRMVNSWGSNWGDSGFWWMSYQAVQSSLLCHGYAYYADDKINYSPELLARYQVSHPKRGTLGIKVGVGTPANSLWEKTYFDFFMGNNAHHPYPAHPIVLDATGGSNHLNPGPQDNFYIRIKDRSYDGSVGTVDFFRGEFIPQAISAAAYNMPVNIPDGAIASVGVPIGGSLSTFPFLLDFQGISMGDSAIQHIAIDNFGNSPAALTLQFAAGSSPHFIMFPDTVSLAPGESQNVTVTYAPPVQGADDGQILIDGTDYAARVRLSGNGLGTIDVSPENYDFGQVTVGDSLAAQFTLKNLSDNSLQVGLLTVGNSAGHFHVQPQQLTLNPLDSAHCMVFFAPQSADMKHARLKITAPGQTHLAGLEGYGVGIAELNMPSSELRKSVLEGDSMIAFFLLENSGSAVLTFNSQLQFSNGNGNWAEIVQPFGSISPGGSRKLMVRLRGISEGSYQASCIISTNEPGAPVYIVPLHLKVIQVNGPLHFTLCYNGQPIDPMQIRIQYAEWNGAQLEAGDEIAVYDGNKCVGTARLRFTVGSGINALEVKAGADDPSTPSIDGFIEGNPIIFKIWDYSDSTEHTVSDVQFFSSIGQPIPAQPFTRNAVVFANLGMITSISPQIPKTLPQDFALRQNYPNPFNPTTTILFTIPVSGRVSIMVYSSLGQTVCKLMDQPVAAGRYSVEWNGRDQNGEPVSSGIYIYRVTFEGTDRNVEKVRKMLLIR